MNLGRTPIVLLGYDNRHKAVERELIVNYTTGELYIRQNGQLVNITTKMINTINNIGSDMAVNIEGVGKLKLNEILLDLIQNKLKCVHATPYNDNINIMRSTTELDRKSIEQTEEKIQVTGFDSASENCIAIKRGGKLQWVDLGELISLPDSNDENPIDGLKGTIVDIYPINDTIYLNASRKQKSTNIKNLVSVILPQTLDGYSRIDWCLETNNVAPTLSFSDNVIWKDGDSTIIQPTINSFHIYIFETWDNGKTWLANMYAYRSNYTIKDDGAIDEAYLRNNIYYKDQTDKLVSWEEEE